MKLHKFVLTCVLAALSSALSGCEADRLTDLAGHPPIIEGYRPADTELALDLGQELTFAVDAVDPDGDRLQHRFIVDGVTVSTGRPTWSYTVDDTGTVEVSCVISDGESEARVDWTLQRRHVNRPPVIRSFRPPQSAFALDLGSSIEFNVDAIDPDGDHLEHFFRVGGKLVSTSDQVTFEAMEPGQVAVEAFVWDGSMVVSHRWVVTVAGPDIENPPVIYERSPVAGELSGRVGSALEFAIRASDPDGDAIEYSFDVDGVVVSSASTYRFELDEPGWYTVTGKASDGVLASSTRWTVQVTANLAPEIVAWTPHSAEVEVSLGAEVTFELVAVDGDGDALTYSGRVDGVERSTGSVLVYEATTAGTHAVSITVSDGLDTAEHTWEMTVVDGVVNYPPVITAYSPPGYSITSWIDDSVTFTVDVSDPNGDPLTTAWYVDGAAAGSGTAYSFAGESGTYDIEARVSDGELMAVQRWQVSVYDVTALLKGRLLDAITAEPVPGLIVQVGDLETTSNSFGQFAFAELPADGEDVFVRDEFDPDLGAYFDYVTPYGSDNGTYLEIYVMPNRPVESAYYADFLVFYRMMTDGRGIPYTTGQRRWELPIQVYVPPLEVEGLDYRATIISALPEFDTILGRPVFEVVDQIPAIGVSVTYPEDIYADNYRVLEWSDDYYPVKGLIQFRSHYKPSTVAAFHTVILHEFGHAVGLRHSADGNHLMLGGRAPSATTFAPVERDVMRALYHIPRGHENLSYIRD